MMVANKWTRFIVTKGSITKHRNLWVQFDGIPGGKLGVGNIYAPNESQDRCKLRENMLIQLPSNCTWILMGDFNMVEFVEDKSRCCNKFLLEMERLLWGQVKSILGIKDFFSSNGSLRFSWDN